VAFVCSNGRNRRMWVRARTHSFSKPRSLYGNQYAAVFCHLHVKLVGLLTDPTKAVLYAFKSC